MSAEPGRFRHDIRVKQNHSRPAAYGLTTNFKYEIIAPVFRWKQIEQSSSHLRSRAARPAPAATTLSPLRWAATMGACARLQLTLHVRFIANQEVGHSCLPWAIIVTKMTSLIKC
jgi:hypothetical protein